MWTGIVRGMERGKMVNALTGEGLMELRETRTGRRLQTLLSVRRTVERAYPIGALGKLTFSPDGKLLAVADDRGRVLLFDLKLGRKIGQISGTRILNTSWTEAFVNDEFGGAATLAFTPDSRFLAAARDDGSIYLYSLRTFLPVARIGQVNSSASVGFIDPHPLKWIAFDARGGALYGFALNGRDILAWDVPNIPESSPAS